MFQDIARGSRETKMKYSANNDGVFVVEVQQSNTQPGANNGSPGRRAMVHHSPITAINNCTIQEQDTPDSPKNNRQQPKKSFGSTNTGLSTSDLSISSSDNPSYAYGNQVGYEQGHYGYPLYSGYATNSVTTIPCESSREPLLSKTPTDPDKPIITAAIFKQDSIIAGDDAMKSTGYNIEGSTDGPLLSDIQAREVSLHKLQDKIEHGSMNRVGSNNESVHNSDTEEERHQEQQRQLGNGTVKKEQTVVEINHDKTNQCLHRADSLPPRLHEDDMQKNGKISDGQKNGNDDNFDTIEEESSIDCYPGDIASGSPLLCHNAGLVAAGARSKRASLPIITPDLYSSLKQSTKIMMPSLSPKFEKFNNENSPMEGMDRPSLPPPLITVTEEAESPMCSDENDSTQS